MDSFELGTRRNGWVRARLAVRRSVIGILRRVRGAGYATPGRVKLCRWNDALGALWVHADIIGPVKNLCGVRIDVSQAPEGAWLYMERNLKPSQTMTPAQVVTNFRRTGLKQARLIVSRHWLLGIWRTEEYRFEKRFSTASGVNVVVLRPYFTLGMPHVL